jgi:predicted nucleotidyltransferase
MDRETVNQQIAKICEIWTREADPEKIILFGSAARGQMSEDSDLDFLVVWEGREFPNNRRRAGFLMKALIHQDIPLAVDAIVLTPEQYKTAASDPNTFTAWIIREGRVLYERLEGSESLVAARDGGLWDSAADGRK